MIANYKPRYSGPNNSGTCTCGHSWQDHHLGIVMNEDYYKSTKEAYAPGACEEFGWNEYEGMMFNKKTKMWEPHCDSYEDSGVIS